MTQYQYIKNKKFIIIKLLTSIEASNLILN